MIFCYNRLMSFWQWIKELVGEFGGFLGIGSTATRGRNVGAAGAVVQNGQNKNESRVEPGHSSAPENGAGEGASPTPPPPETGGKTENAPIKKDEDESSPVPGAGDNDDGVKGGEYDSSSPDDGNGDNAPPPATTVVNDATADTDDAARVQKDGVKAPDTPHKIGPRRDNNSNNTNTKKAKAKQPGSKPGLICREKRNWEIAVAAPQGCEITDVQQGGSALQAEGGVYRLRNFTEQVLVKYRNDGEAETTTFENKPPLIFRTGKEWKGTGRNVRGISRGHFVVFAPREWKRAADARVDIGEEECADEDFLAHYFDADNLGASDGFDEYPLRSVDDDLRLEGKTVFDNSGEGELFIEHPPELSPTAAHARVGSEGGDWDGENFIPGERTLENVMNGRQGRFFIRVFGADVKRTGSEEFRYFSDLREIRVNGIPHAREGLLLPAATGHTKAEIRFVGADGNNIFPQSKNNGAHVVVGDNGAATIKPSPDADATNWTLTSDKGSVDVAVVLPRVWWRSSFCETEEWSSAPFKMDRDGFSGHVSEGGTIKIRLPYGAGRVDAGWSGMKKFEKKLSVRRDGDHLCAELPLRAFVGYREFAEQKRALVLQVQCGEKRFAVVRISGDVLPVSVVKSANGRSGRREGKGYSRGELSAAGLTVLQAREFGAKVDMRRRTAHPENIANLPVGE